MFLSNFRNFTSPPRCTNGYSGTFNAGGNSVMDLHPIQGGVEIFLVDSCYGNRGKFQPDGPLGLYADLTFLTCFQKILTITFVTY